MTSTMKYANMNQVYISVLFVATLFYAAMVFAPVLTFIVVFLLQSISFIVNSMMNTKMMLVFINKTEEVHKLGFMGLTIFERTIFTTWYIVIFAALYLLFPYEPSYSLFWEINQWLFGQLFTLYLATIIVNSYILGHSYKKVRVDVIKRIEELVQERQTNNVE